MGISAIVHIADRLLQRNASDAQQNGAGTQTAHNAPESRANRTEFGDTFTRSGQTNAGTSTDEAAFVQAEQLRFAARTFQTGTGNQGPANAAGTSQAQTPPAAVEAAPAAGPQPAPASAADAGSAKAVAPYTQTQENLQTLNSDLSALGLNAAEIAAFDQFASVLLQYDPNALQDLENELNLLAAQFQTQAGAQAGGTQQATANSPGFQLNELSITFRNFTGATGAQGPNAAGQPPAQVSGFTLEVQAVTVTLGNAAGQTAQIQVPSAAKSSGNASVASGANNPTAPAAQAATA